MFICPARGQSPIQLCYLEGLIVWRWGGDVGILPRRFEVVPKKNLVL